MPGIDPTIMVHRLYVDLSFRLVKQNRRPVNRERSDVIVEEVNKLLKARYIKEVLYLEWISNVVLFKKSNEKCCMCLDTNLNKACPNHCYPLPWIDQLVDDTICHELLTCMDAYSNYNQNKMHVLDQEHTLFITKQCLYCYKVMSSGLKNVEMMYHRMVNRMFPEADRLQHRGLCRRHTCQKQVKKLTPGRPGRYILCPP